MNTSDGQVQSTLLCVDQLQVSIPTGLGMVRAVDGVSFSLNRGKTLGIVGESGCGKSVLCRSILGLLPKGSVLSNDSKVVFNGQTLNCLPDNMLNKFRGREIAIVFQDPMTALNPVITIGRQISEQLEHHLGMRPKEALKRSVELMASVKIPKPLMRLKQYPHQLSGGLRQRVVIAMALSCSPKLLIADEPTTALDVTVQAEILDLLDDLKRENNMAMILVTHDLSVAAARCQDVAVMYAGKFVETATTKALFSHMKMPYTQALFDCRPQLETPVHTTLSAIAGQPPILTSPLKGCGFAPRCIYSSKHCYEEKPRLLPVDHKAHRSACWHPLTPANQGVETRESHSQ